MNPIPRPGRPRPPLVRRLLDRRANRSRGQAVVELALILPIILVLLASALDLGRLFYSQITVNDASREGVLEASRDPSNFIANTACTAANKDANRVMCRTLNEAKGGFVAIAPTDVTMTCSTGTCPTTAVLGNTVSVSVTGHFRLITPILAVFFGGQDVTFASTSSAQLLAVPAVTASGPVSGFSVTPTSGTAPLPVTVTDASSNGPTTWSWAWGDGVTATGQNPGSHTYSLSGTYTITQTVSNSNGTSVTTHTVTVAAAPAPTPTPPGPVAPVAIFSVTPNTGAAPLAVTVTESSTGTPTSWAWTFGDGGTSTVQSPPAHTYATTGVFSITLTVTNAAGSNSVSHTVNAAAACTAPVANFTRTPASGAKNVTNFAVTNNTTNMTTAGCNNVWSWNYGDGTGISSLQNPGTHQYDKKGDYTITLTASNNAGTSTFLQTVTVSN
jgi:PKD repeat protein